MKPILLNILGEPIFSYPLLMGFGWGVGFNYSLSWWERNGLKKIDLWKIFLGSFLFGWIGAKLFFLVFSAPDKALDYSMEVNFWLGGGFVFYGGLIFSAAFASAYSKFSKNFSFRDLANLAPGLALGHAIGRIGCLLAGCCYGSHCDLPIGIVFKGVPRHPVQLYEAIGLALLFIVLREFLKKGKNEWVLIQYFVGYSAIRFVLEFFRGDAIRGEFFTLSTSQWISLSLITMTLVVLLGKRIRLR